jgi:hypothetical protein
MGVDLLEIRSEFAYPYSWLENADFARTDIEYVREKLYFLISIAPDT